MPDLWFVVGLAVGMVLMGFVTIGSFDRGADSVRRNFWNAELVARKTAFMTARSRQALMTPFVPDLVTVPVAAAIPERQIAHPAPAAERRTRLRRDHSDVLAHLSL